MQSRPRRIILKGKLGAGLSRGLRSRQVGIKGQAGGTVREYSDTLLIFLLKGMKPEKYRERYQVDHNVKTWDDMVFEIAREDGLIEDDSASKPPGDKDTLH